MQLIPNTEEAKVLIAFASVGMAFLLVFLAFIDPNLTAKKWWIYAFLGLAGTMLLGDAVSGGS